MQYPDDDGPIAEGAGQPTEARRLQAALEALAARDQVLADRTRRLAALEDAAARLTLMAARLEETEEELVALKRARRAELAARDQRVAELERRLAETPHAPASSDLSEAQAPPGDTAEAHRLRLELELERLRSFRLAARRPEGEPGEASGLPATGREAPGPPTPSPTDPYAYWEEWFHRRLRERGSADLARAEERLAQLHAVLEEKERLISLLIGRLRDGGRVREGPDDLKEVSGIGPVIEDLLHSLGIVTFEQVAALTDDELESIGDRLGAFRERARRDGWREQAAELAQRRVRLGPELTVA